MQPSIPWSSSVSIFVIEIMAINHFLRCIVPFSFTVPLFSLAVIHCYLLSLFVTHFIIRCHSLSLIVIRCHSLSFFVTRCATRCHSLSLDVPLFVTRCHLLSLVVTRLSFYERSYWKVKKETFLRKICCWFSEAVVHRCFSKEVF